MSTQNTIVRFTTSATEQAPGGSPGTHSRLISRSLRTNHRYILSMQGPKCTQPAPRTKARPSLLVSFNFSPMLLQNNHTSIDKFSFTAPLMPSKKIPVPLTPREPGRNLSITIVTPSTLT